MKTKNLIPLILLLTGSLFLGACNAAATQAANDPTAIPIVENFATVAEGRLVPKESVQLAFVTGGQVAEIRFEEGDSVRAGDVIALLGEREPLEAALAGAELELLASNLELTAARLELLQAQQANDQLYENWPGTATQAQQALTDARQAVHDSERTLSFRTSTAPQFDIDTAWSQVVLAEDALDKAEEDFEPYRNKPEDSKTRAAFQNKLATAQKAYDQAVRQYNAILDGANDFEVSQAEASYNIAQAQLEQAEKDYSELKDGPDPDEIALADARIAAAEARIATAEGKAESAQANIAAAQAALDNLALTATFDGTLVKLDLLVGEQVGVGAPVATLADFSQWYVETDNLTEIEVVSVRDGQTVSVIPDALPEIEINGHVESINDVFEEKRGDVTYTAHILLDDFDPRLRWGMTVVVTFEE